MKNFPYSLRVKCEKGGGGGMKSQVCRLHVWDSDCLRRQHQSEHGHGPCGWGLGLAWQDQEGGWMATGQIKELLTAKRTSKQHVQLEVRFLLTQVRNHSHKSTQETQKIYLFMPFGLSQGSRHSYDVRIGSSHRVGVMGLVETCASDSPSLFFLPIYTNKLTIWFHSSAVYYCCF